MLYKYSPLVLIVDDNRTTTAILEGFLREAGYDTVCAYNLAHAESLIQTRTISLILLDIHLPDGNGLDFCARLTSDTTMVPILFISASDDIDNKIRGFAAGGVDYITKPLQGEEVLARVRTHLRLRAAYESLAHLHEERIQRLTVSQQSIMPQPESLPQASFHVYLRQALLAGGDFYDVIPTGSRVTDYVVADASGHDLGVSLWTASFKTLLTEYASILHSPLNICQMINRSMRQVLPEGVFFTALYARLNRDLQRLVLVNAGHPSAVLVSALDGTGQMLEQDGDVIGAFSDVCFGVLEVQVRPQDRLFLYSDGLLETGKQLESEKRRLKQVCCDTMMLPLKKAVTSIAEIMGGDAETSDDIVLLGVEI